MTSEHAWRKPQSVSAKPRRWSMAAKGNVADLQERMDRASVAPPWEVPPVDSYVDDPAAQSENKTGTPKIVLRRAHEIVAERRETQWLIYKVLEGNVLAIIAGARSTFKSFIAL